MTTVKQTPLFFFDTADLDVIQNVWDRLGPYVPDEAMAGITTNPSALAKVNCDDLDKFETLTYKLARFVSSVRKNDINFETGTVHVQLPSSTATEAELVAWTNYVKDLGDGRCHIAMKIPPYKHILDIVSARSLEEKVQINVTGTSDAATALRCFSYPQVSYVSIIPGRMEEVGIDATKHLNLVHQRYKAFAGEQYVIAGSMRTVDGLKRSIAAGCVPTIGQRVWDAMTDQDYKEFASWWSTITPTSSYIDDIPQIDQTNIDLTDAFFKQMDELGQPLYKAFAATV